VDTSPCSKNEFECGNRMCVSDKAKCNGIYDCLDQTDEKDCRKYCLSHKEYKLKYYIIRLICTKETRYIYMFLILACDLETHFRCGIQCLIKTKMCDGVSDCWNGHDELNCTRKYIRFQCL